MREKGPNCGAQVWLQYQSCKDEVSRDCRKVGRQVEDTLGDPGVGRVHGLSLKRGGTTEQGIGHATHGPHLEKECVSCHLGILAEHKQSK